MTKKKIYVSIPSFVGYGISGTICFMRIITKIEKDKSLTISTQYSFGNADDWETVGTVNTRERVCDEEK